ncbi:hypothetical protein BJX70DRAFT_398105 [Aspergillus crustosus]
MAICITFGTHEFTSMLEGYENVRAYCYNCMFLMNFVTSAFSLLVHFDIRDETEMLIDKYRSTLERTMHYKMAILHNLLYSTHKYKEVTCYTCRFTQDLRDRPDINPNTKPPPNMGYGPQPPPQAHYEGHPQQQQQYPPPQQQQQYPPVASGATSSPPQQQQQQQQHGYK